MIGVVILAHEHLNRTEALARHLASSGCCVMLHIDRRVPKAAMNRLRLALAGEPMIGFSKRVRCEWGTYSLVDAALTAVRQLLATWPDVSHVCQISGACLPLRPIAELQAHLAARPDTDFIESVSVEQDGWVLDGLSSERFTLYFPFSWRRHRRIFDRFVDLQRKYKVRRKMPSGLKPHLGSQWWCLSRETLQGILDDPDLPLIERYFRLTWIPDESFFQTMVRKHGRNIVSSSLTFVKFDLQGKPFIFYDDHMPLLLNAEAFFARKIWPGADRLYEVFLGPKLAEIQPERRETDRITRAMQRAANIRSLGRPGLINQNRYTSRWFEPNFATARPFFVFDGLDRVFPNFLPGLRAGAADGMDMHGYLYEPDRIEFADGGTVFAGNLTNDVPLRDYRPDQFLVNLIWGRRQVPQAFLMNLGKAGPMNAYIIRDPNAQIIRIRDAWLIDAMHSATAEPERTEKIFAEFSAQADRLEVTLQEQIKHYDGRREMVLRADILSFDLVEVFLKPVSVARAIQEVLPPAADISDALKGPVLPVGFDAFLDRIAVAGITVPGHKELRRIAERSSDAPALIRTV